MLNMNNVDMCVLEISALCIVVLPRKRLHLLSTNSHSIYLVLYIAVHSKTGCLHSKLFFDKPNCISKPIIIYLISAPQIGNKLRNPKPSFHPCFSIFTCGIQDQILHSKSSINFVFQKHCFVFII